MNKQNLSSLQRELISNLSLEDLLNKDLLKLGASLLAQYKSAKSAIRKLTLDNTVDDIEHWLYVKNFTFSELDSVIQEIKIRSSDIETFENSELIGFINLVAKSREAYFIEDLADKAAAPVEEQEIKFIIE
jgi:hypothetical protein